MLKIRQAGRKWERPARRRAMRWSRTPWEKNAGKARRAPGRKQLPRDSQMSPVLSPGRQRRIWAMAACSFGVDAKTTASGAAGPRQLAER